MSEMISITVPGNRAYFLDGHIEQITLVEEMSDNHIVFRTPSGRYFFDYYYSGNEMLEQSGLDRELIKYPRSYNFYQLIGSNNPVFAPIFKIEIYPETWEKS